MLRTFFPEKKKIKFPFQEVCGLGAKQQQQQQQHQP